MHSEDLYTSEPTLPLFALLAIIHPISITTCLSRPYSMLHVEEETEGHQWSSGYQAIRLGSVVEEGGRTKKANTSTKNSWSFEGEQWHTCQWHHHLCYGGHNTWRLACELWSSISIELCMTFPATKDSPLSSKVDLELLQDIYKPSRNIRIRFHMKDHIRMTIYFKIIFGPISDLDWILQYWSELVAHSVV